MQEYTHTHTDSFREIRKGEKAFINDIKILIKKMTDYKNSLSFLRAKEREGEHGRNKIKNAK